MEKDFGNHHKSKEIPLKSHQMVDSSIFLLDIMVIFHGDLLRDELLQGASGNCFMML